MSEPIENPDRQIQRDILGMLSSLNTNLASSQTDVTSLQDGQSALQTNVSALQVGQASLEGSVRQIVVDQTRLQVEVMARIDRLQTTVETGREMPG